MSEVDTALLHATLDAHRIARGLSWRDVASETGLSPSTFSRLPGQQPGLDGYVVMCRWLGMPMETFTRRRGPSEEPTLSAELATLLHRHGLLDADQRFIQAAILALDNYRNATEKPAA